MQEPAWLRCDCEPNVINNGGELLKMKAMYYAKRERLNQMGSKLI